MCAHYRITVHWGLSGVVTLLTGLWFTHQCREQHTHIGQASSIHGLLFRRRPQGNTTEQTEHTDIRGKELPACPTALGFITAATDAAFLPPLPAEISILQPSSTSPTSQSRHPNSAVLRQTNSAIWFKSRKDHCGIFSRYAIVYPDQRCNRSFTADEAVATRVWSH